MENGYEQVYTVNGNLQAEMIRLFLQTHGIIARPIQESAGATYGLTVGPLGEVRIYVETERAEEARQILRDMEAGKYELPSISPSTPGQGEADEPEEDDFL
ncbi:MAG TPA: DUF2007 domain-containing protein [Anaerolineaceae bacterium]|nr:DUF2007 domain-containing protein [Anaerolineaceae bacterium]